MIIEKYSSISNHFELTCCFAKHGLSDSFTQGITMIYLFQKNFLVNVQKLLD